MNLPTLNMVGWTILDYELAFDGIRQLNEASLWLQNQPRSATKHVLHPGAAFIADIGEGWCSEVMTEIIDSLRAIRFPDPKDEERRVLLLLQNATRHGGASDPLADILAMALKQSVRPAAA